MCTFGKLIPLFRLSCLFKRLLTNSCFKFRNLSSEYHTNIVKLFEDIYRNDLQNRLYESEKLSGIEPRNTHQIR